MLATPFVFVAVVLAVPLGLNHQATLVATGPAGELFATAVARAGDVDGDGRDDLLVLASDGGLEFVRVLSGLDAAVLHTFGPVSTGAFFFPGSPVAGVGDVNGDGRDDVVVGNSGANEARVHSGLDGSLLHLLSVPFLPDGERFGGSVASAGDVDADGTPDVVVGGLGYGLGVARVFSGSNGALLRELAIPATGVEFGRALAGIGDVNGDGHADVAVGAPSGGRFILHPGVPPFLPPLKLPDAAGAVYVFSGLDGALLFRVVGDDADDGLGFSLAATGDVNGDGVPDFVVGTRQTSPPTAGYARVVSGLDGTVLHTFPVGAGTDPSLVRVAGPGDLDGDGHGDVLVGCRSGDPAHPDAEVFSGFDGSSLFQYEATAPFAFAVSVCGLGDVDFDGTPDFAVGVAQSYVGGGFAQWFVSQ